MKKIVALALTASMVLTMALTGCGKSGDTTGQSSQETTGQAATSATQGKSEPVTLKFMHYQSEGQEVFTKIVDDFMAANSNIKIEADLSGGDQYKTILKTKFAAGEAADIVGVHPGMAYAIAFAKAGYLEDLTNEAFMKDIDEGAKRMATDNGKVYALPIDASYIATLYNKDIFARNNLSVPKTWKEFLDVCGKLKQNNITPIAIGNKDLWVTQIIPFAIAPTVIYSGNINFDSDMYAGKTKFSGPEWQKILEMQMELNKNKYFNDGVLSTTYDQANALFAQGKAAMTVMGTWVLNPIKEMNKDINIGLFVFPASEDGNNWASSAVGGMLGIYANSPHKAEAKKFLEFFMSKDVYSNYLRSTSNFPTVKGVTVDFDPAAQELSSQVTNTYNFLDQNWPAGVQDTLFKSIQENFAGKDTKAVLEQLDKEWANRTKN